MRRLLIAASCSLLVTTASSSAQPIYKTMVECGAIYSASAELIRSKPKKRMLTNAAKIWRIAAEKAVTDARMPDASRYVAMMHDERLRKWRSKSTRSALTSEYREGTASCLSLANAHGLDLRTY